MPVTILTTKEQKLAKLVQDMREAGLMVTEVRVEQDYFDREFIGGGYRSPMLAQRRISASIEVVGASEDAMELLKLWATGRHGMYKVR